MGQDQDRIEPPEVININGMDFSITPQDGEPPKVELPPEFSELSQEEKDKLYPKIQEGSKTIGTYYKKLAETNSKSKQLTEWEENLKKREAALKTGGDGAEADRKEEEITPLWKKLGLTSEDQEEDYMLENTAKYNKALREHMREVAQHEVKKGLGDVETRVRQEARLSILNNRIAEAGVDPAEVAAFAKETGMPYSEKAFDVYVRYHSIKVNPIVDATIKAQEKQIQFIESAGNTNVQALVKKMEQNPESVTDAELDILIAESKRQLKRTQ